MEGYRSYPEGPPPEPQQYPAEGQGWYGDQGYRAQPYPEQGYGYRESGRHDETRADPGGLVDPARVANPAPRPGPRPGEEPAMPRRPVAAPGSPGPTSDGVYRSKRPAAAVLIGLPAVLLELPALFLLRDATFADPASASGVISAASIMLALPLLALGLYAVATGAVRAAGPNSAQAWLRPPVAYLSVGLVLFLAAGLAA